MSVRPTPDQVLALAPDRAAATAAGAAADPAAWSAAGCDDTAVWGHYIAGSAEPYEVSVELIAPAFRCTCPSRKLPCKHCLGLLLLYAHDHVATARRLNFVDVWLQRRAAREAAFRAGLEGNDDVPDETELVAPAAMPPVDAPAAVEVGLDALGTGASRSALRGDDGKTKRRTERAERMRAGLVEFDRWLIDRVRAGLAAPELAAIATWDHAAARLVDAQCGGLANRVKRVAMRVGAHSAWHEDVLEELAILHLMVQGALRTSALPELLADGVHVATGLTTARVDVLAGVPTTATWCVVGESRTREDRITVQRTWLCTAGPGPHDVPTWAVVLSFGTISGTPDSDLSVGTEFAADVHWYPGAVPLRALVGVVHRPAAPLVVAPPARTVLQASTDAGWAIANEPWLERAPMCVHAKPVPVGNGRWVLADHTGALALVPGCTRLAELVSISGGEPLSIMGEWSIEGFAPLTVWIPVGGGAVSAVAW